MQKLKNTALFLWNYLYFYKFFFLRFSNIGRYDKYICWMCEQGNRMVFVIFFPFNIQFWNKKKIRTTWRWRERHFIYFYITIHFALIWVCFAFMLNIFIILFSFRNFFIRCHYFCVLLLPFRVRSSLYNIQISLHYIRQIGFQAHLRSAYFRYKAQAPTKQKQLAFSCKSQKDL